MINKLLVYPEWSFSYSFLAADLEDTLNFKRTQSWEIHGPHRSLWRAVAALGAAAVVGLRAAHLAAASLV